MIDAHVHLFPDKLFDAIWNWFDRNAWTIRQKLYAEATIAALEEAGNSHVVGLLYAHRTGMAEELNAWMGALARRHPTVIPCATVHPRDGDLAGILKRAVEVHGARLIKQHCHVLNLAPDDPVMFPLYEAAIGLGLPINLHVGNGPKLPGYAMPTDAVSGAARTEAVLRRYPELRLIVPHLGCMEEDAFFAFLDRYPNLYLDTTMAMVPFLPGLEVGDRRPLASHPGRILFGTDFPNIPYELDAERKAIEALGLPPPTQQEILHNAAARLFSLAPIG